MPTKKELSVIPKRSKATIALNKKLKIVKLDHYKAPNGAIVTGHAFIVPDRGVLAFKKDRQPYTPVGGVRALQEILDAGGFLSYKDLTFYKITPTYYRYRPL